MILRELLVRLGLDVDAQSFAKGEAAVEIVKAGLEKLVEFGKETIEKVNEVSEYGEHIKDLAQTTGLATSELQQLGKAAAAEGVGIDEFGHSIVILSKTMSAAADGGEEQAKAFKKLGVQIKNSDGTMRSAGDVFEDIAEGISKMPDGVEKTALSMKLLGKSGAEMIPVLNNGAEEIEKFRKSAVMSDSDIEAGDEVIKLQRQLTAQTKSLWREAIAPLLPAIRDLLKKYLEWKKSNAEIMKQRIRQWIGYAITGIKVLTGLMKFLIDNATAVAAVVGVLLVNNLRKMSTEAVLTGLKTAAAWATAALPFIAIGAAIAALLLVFDDLRVYAKGGDSLFGRFEKQIKEWARSDHDDPWWLKAIKGLVDFLVQAIEMIHEFNELFDDDAHKKAVQKIGEQAGMSKAQIQAQVDAGNLKNAKKQLAAGGQLTDNARASLKRAGLNEQSFVAQYSPSIPTGPAGNMVTNIQAPVNMTVNVPPGTDGKTFSEQFAAEFNNHLEAAAATAPSIPGG